MHRVLAVAIALGVAATSGAQPTNPPAVVQTQPQPLPPECLERDADPEKCVIKDGSPPPPRVRKPALPPPPPELQPPSRQEPSLPKLAPRT